MCASQGLADPLALPRDWRLADGKCMHCGREQPPAPAPETTFTRVATGFCNDNPDFRGDECPETDNSCFKEVRAGGRRSGEEGDPWNAISMPLEECEVLAARDPECSTTMFYETNQWGGWCYCWRREECCGRCRPAPTWGQTTLVFDTKPRPPDPACTTPGSIKSADGKLCCPAECKNAEGQSVCGELWDCHNDVVGGGSCCTVNTNMTCTEAGPPCLL